MAKTIFISFFFILICCSCNSDKEKGNLLAKVYSEELFEVDLEFLFENKEYTIDDSILITENYIDKWVNEQILIHQAKENKEIDKGKIDRKIESFKNDLLIMELEKILVDKRLDTSISETEIEDYYKKHKQDFQLNDYLVKVLYLKISSDAPDIDKINNQYKLRNDSDIEEIDIYAKIYASNYYYDEDNWIYFDDLLKEIPLHNINKDRFILKRSKTRFEESGFYYFLNIIDYKLKNTTSPLNFERNNIKERILNIRVKNLREQNKQEIISKAYDKNAVTIY